MSPQVMTMMVLFNTSVAEFRDKLVPNERIFVGVQPGPIDQSGAFAWTKCVPESRVFVTQVAEKTLQPDRVEFAEYGIRFIAAHEVCHVLLHRKQMCREAPLEPHERAQMETEANRCAVELVSR